MTLSISRLIYGLAALVLLALPCRAAIDPAEMCERAAAVASAETGVPLDILMTLTLTETGRRSDGQFRPWGWSVNAAGDSNWFDDPGSAINFANSLIYQGKTNLDIGCFQLNYRWHGEHFASVEQMFDPLQNARYAARFVAELYQETGDWRRAAGGFHSRTPFYAERYLARFDALRATVLGQGLETFGATPQTDSFFPALASERRSRAPRERVMLLGSPLGSPVSGAPGSLAVIAQVSMPLSGAPGSVLGAGASVPLIGGTGPPDGP